VHELFPIVAGMVIGLIARHLITTQLRIATLVLGSTLFGAIASFMSGELLVSLAYLAFDAAQVLIVACTSMVLVAAWRRRATRWGNVHSNSSIRLKRREGE
jgi:uncharacterized membrane protein YeaQ/YmgE (transglycosylase-associated protein family)